MKTRAALSLLMRVLMSLSLSLPACSHAPRDGAARSTVDAPLSQPEVVPPQVSEYHLHKLVPYTLRVRRPSVPGANPKAGPGGTDYRTDPLPDEHLDCHDTAWLLREVPLEPLRQCLMTVRKNTSVNYSVRWLPVPRLELDEDSAEDAPCLRKTLPQLPLPREILYQSMESGRAACYSSRLAIESNEIAGFKLPMHRLEVRIALPLDREVPVVTDEQLRAALMGWVLTPFWEGDTLPARLVPDAICRACLGEKTMLKPSDAATSEWPQQ